MCKKLLVAVFVLSFLLALSSAAFAFKDPNHIQRIPNSLPEAPKASFDRNVAFPDMPPQYSKPISAATPAVVSGTFTRAPADCETLSYWDGTPYWFWSIPDAYGDDFFNMRFTPAAGQDATLDVVYLGFYDGSTVVSADGVDIIVWDDDGFGFPGTEIARINVAAVDMVWYPNAVVADFASFAIDVTDADFHVGYTTVNQTDDVYSILSDEGTTGTLRSTEFYGGMWGTMLNDWGIDVNFVIEADVCYTGGEGPECAWLWYGTYAAYYYWTIPDDYGDDFFNERFTNEEDQPCTLKTAEINMYEAASVDVTGEGIDLYVWWDDGGGFPGATIIPPINIPTASILWYPSANIIDLTSYNIIIPPNSDFHIGYSTVNQGAGNIMAVLSDDGSGPAEYRSSEWWGAWGTMLDDWGVDVDFLIAAEVCWETGPPPECYLLAYNGDAYYFWTIPDAYGDDYFNVRFTMPDVDCWLMDLNIAFYQGASVGAPGADFIVFNSDGTFPTDTVAVYVVPVVTSWFPVYETVDVEADNIVIFGDFHLGYTPIYNDPADVLACLSDDGSSGTLRSSEWWGLWGLMFDDWGVDAAFLMEVNVCCPVEEEVEYTCVEETEWPTLSHDYARTGDSRIEIGDLCGFQKIWEYWSPLDFCYFANPTIANELVYAAFGVHMECFTVAGDGMGGPVSVWSTMTADPAYAIVLGGNVRTSPTIEDGVVYFGAGTLEGFIAADAFTGIPIWIRTPMPPYSNPLEGVPGATRFTPTVIIGEYVYFGSDGGYIYKLNKFTGITSAWTATPYGNGVWVSPSSDGTDLYFGCSAGTTGGDAGAGAAVGGVYKYDPNLVLHPGWTYGGFAGLLGWNEGCTNGASYSASTDMLFTQLALADHTGFDSYNMMINAADGTPMAANYWLCGLGYYSNVTLFEDPLAQMYFYGSTPGVDLRYDGIWCRSYDNNTKWQDFTRGNMMSPAGLTCDAYVFWGTRAHPYGTFNCSKAANGDPIFTYNLTGYGFGPAIAKYAGVPYVAQTQIWSDCGTGGGRLTMYSMGDDRPRLVAPSAITIEPPLEFIDPAGTQRTAEDAFCNAGCVPLEYCLTLEAHPSYPTAAYVTTVNPYSLTRANKNAADVAEFTIDDFNAMDGWKAAKMQNNSVLRSEYGDRVLRQAFLAPTGAMTLYLSSTHRIWVVDRTSSISLLQRMTLTSMSVRLLFRSAMGWKSTQ